MKNTFQITNMILDEIRDMTINSAKDFPSYGIRAERTPVQTYIYIDTEMHYSKSPTRLRTFIMRKVKKVHDLQRLNNECEAAGIEEIFKK